MTELKWFLAFICSYCLCFLLYKLFSDVLKEDKSKLKHPITISISTFIICIIINLLISYNHTRIIIVKEKNQHINKQLREGDVYYIENNTGIKDSIIVDAKYTYIYNKSDYDLIYYKVYYGSYYNNDYSHIIKPNNIYKASENLDYILKKPPMVIMGSRNNNSIYKTGICISKNDSIKESN